MPGPAGRSGPRIRRMPATARGHLAAHTAIRYPFDTVLLEYPACPRHLCVMAPAAAGFRNDLIGDFTMDATSNAKTATLTVGNKTYDFPILSGTVGPDVIDIAKLYAQAGMFTYDPGFTSTGSCQSKITYIDGDAGILEYRGYPIEQLAEHGDFLETCYLLLYGELPTKAQKKDFDQRVIHHTMVHEQMARFFQGFRRDAHPMAIMVASVGALAAFYHDSTDINDPQQRMIASMRMIAKIPTLAAMAFKYTIGQPFVYPKNSLSFAENFLQHVLRGAVRGIQDQSGAGRRARQDLHPARRPRAERLDLDGADRRLFRRQPVRLHRRRHRLPVGTGAWRRQRSGAGDAGRHRHGRQDSRIHQEGEGQEQRSPPDGLRPSRLQELRSARQDHAEDVSRGAGGDRPWRRSDAEGRAGTGKDRAAATNISSTASSIRTSTSIRASR